MNLPMRRSGVRMNARLLLACLAVSVLALTGCPRKNIPNTQIEDTEETRQIIAVMDKFRQAMEGRDAEALMSLVSPEFRDTAGTSLPDDDLDFQTLGPALKDRFEKIDNVKLSFDIRSIEVQEDLATAVFHWSLRYDVPSLGSKQQTAAEIKKMMFKLENEQWKIVSGI